MSIRSVAERDDLKTRDALRSRATLLGLLLGLPLSALFVWLVLGKVDVDEAWAVLSDADFRMVLPAVIANGGVYVAQTLRWRTIARTPDVSVATFGGMVLSGIAVNNVLPGRIGDLLRARWLHLASGLPVGRALATVFIDRSCDVLTLVVFLAISLPLVTSAEWLERIALASLALLLALGLVLVAARLYAKHRARGRRGERSLLRRIVRDTIEGLADLPRGRRAVVVAGISLAAWLTWAVAAWFVARSVGIELSAVEALFVTAVMNLGVAIPSSPGFIGTYQWLGVSVLALLDVGPEQALAFAILMHAVWYVPTTVLGGALLIRRGVGTIRIRRLRQTTTEQGAHDP